MNEHADMECPTAQTCSMHASAQAWLRAGDRDAIDIHLDVMWVLRRGAWRHCTCRLFDRILSMIGKDLPARG